MSLSDCAKCWETPCVCGHDYRDRKPEWIRDQIAMLQRVLAEVSPPAPRSMQRVAVKLPLSPKAKEALAKARTAWEAAMESVPAQVRNRLDVHQIYKTIEWDVDAGFAPARVKLKLDKEKDKGTSIHHTFAFNGADVEHVYYYFKAG